MKMTRKRRTGFHMSQQVLGPQGKHHCWNEVVAAGATSGGLLGGDSTEVRILQTKTPREDRIQLGRNHVKGSRTP